MASDMMRWDPFREMVTLRDAMDTLFENALIRPQSGTSGSTFGNLPLDLEETDDNFIVRVSIPGIRPEDVDVSVTDNVLTIKGEVKVDQKKEGARYHVRERRWGAFGRQVALPAGVDANKVQAEYSDGVLLLTLPKAEQAKPKRIQIRTSGQSNGQPMLEGQAQKRS